MSSYIDFFTYGNCSIDMAPQQELENDPVDYLGYLLLVAKWTFRILGSAIVTFFGVMLILYGPHYTRAMFNLVDGLEGYPIVGILKLIDKDFHLYLFDHSKNYKKGFFSLNMGLQHVVCLSKAKHIKRVFNSPDFNARPKLSLIPFIQGYGKTIATSLLN